MQVSILLILFYLEIMKENIRNLESRVTQLNNAQILSDHGINLNQVTEILKNIQKHAGGQRLEDRVHFFMFILINK